MFKLRPYQEEISTNWSNIVKNYWVLLLAMEVRTWKTITVLSIAKKLWKKRVLFLTKIKAMSSIKDDYAHFEDDFEMVVINYESMHKVEWAFDMVICDESHTLSTFPKPSNKQKNVKKFYWHLDMVFLSWTPTPESYSQFFHMFFTKKNWPFVWYANFYRWADVYVKKYEIRTSFGKAVQYDRANYDAIMKVLKPVIITLTQKEAWFTTSVEENILHVKMTPKTYSLIARLQKDKVIEAWEEVILADTKVKEASKVHQMYSGTVKTEAWNYFVLDSTKWKFIKKRFAWKKIWIFYNFKAERELLKKVYWDEITEDLEEFKKTDKNIMLQIVSGREWISLKEADCLVFFNIAFSAVSYFQSRDRLTTKERTENTIYRIFSEWWIEDQVYKAVKKKKKFTSKMYDEWLK